MSKLQFEIIGFLGAGLVIISALPQLFTIISRKSSKDVSIYTYIILLSAQILWSVYGFLKSDLQIISCNVASGFITILIIVFGLYYKK
jgi:MtN3 and saliva related transmembrane protein